MPVRDFVTRFFDFMAAVLVLFVWLMYCRCKSKPKMVPYNHHGCWKNRFIRQRRLWSDWKKPIIKALLNKSVFQHSSWLYGIILNLLLHSQHTMPYKHNESRRHKIKKSRYKVTNWHDYNNGLRQRGDVTIWFTEEAIADWHPEKTGARGRPQVYSDIAIETTVFIRQVFHLPLRQTEGFMNGLPVSWKLTSPFLTCDRWKSSNLAMHKWSFRHIRQPLFQVSATHGK